MKVSLPKPKKPDNITVEMVGLNNGVYRGIHPKLNKYIILIVACNFMGDKVVMYCVEGDDYWYTSGDFNIVEVINPKRYIIDELTLKDV